MATELRRSTRARTQVKSYAEEQAEQERPTATKVRSTTKTKTTRKKRTKAETDDFEADELPVTTLEADADDDYEVEEVVPKKKRATKSKKSTDDGGQLYNNPAEGTMIAWGSKVRKQPKIYEAPKEKRAASGKGKAEDTRWLSDAGETRIARELAKIKPLAPGAKETRLRE